MKINPKLALIASAFAFIVVVYIVFYSMFQSVNDSLVCGQRSFQKMIPNYMLWISMGLMAIIIIPLSNYFISKKMEEKMQKNFEAISKIFDQRTKSNLKKINLKKSNKTLKSNTEILKFLGANEKKMVEKLLESNGIVLQSEVSRMGGMNKLKTHRAAKELERKQIIKTESYGKTKKLILSEDMKDLFKKN